MTRLIRTDQQTLSELDLQTTTGIFLSFENCNKTIRILLFRHKFGLNTIMSSIQILFRRTSFQNRDIFEPTNQFSYFNLASDGK